MILVCLFGGDCGYCRLQGSTSQAHSWWQGRYWSTYLSIALDGSVDVFSALLLPLIPCLVISLMFRCLLKRNLRHPTCYQTSIICSSIQGEKYTSFSSPLFVQPLNLEPPTTSVQYYVHITILLTLLVHSHAHTQALSHVAWPWR